MLGKTFSSRNFNFISYFFPQKTEFDYSCKEFPWVGDNLHEHSKPISLGKNKKHINSLSAEFALRVLKVQRKEYTFRQPCQISLCLPSEIKGLDSPVMTDSTRNLYIPENHFAFHLSLFGASPSKKKKTKRATAKNKGADQSARTCRLICAFVVRTCIKESFLSGSYEDLNHGSYTSRTTFC